VAGEAASRLSGCYPSPSPYSERDQRQALAARADQQRRQVRAAGVAGYANEQGLVITDDDKITVTDLHGEILIEDHPPAPGVTYVGNGRLPGSC
jgi:hypothetical protein